MKKKRNHKPVCADDDCSPCKKHVRGLLKSAIKCLGDAQKDWSKVVFPSPNIHGLATVRNAMDALGLFGIYVENIIELDELGFQVKWDAVRKQKNRGK